MSDRAPAPELGGETEVFAFERASATPAAGPIAGAAKNAARAANVAPIAASLGELQRWFAGVVTHAEGVREGVAAASAASAASAEVGGEVGGKVGGEDDLGRVVTAGPRLSALERMGIYHYAYRARLVECLRDDYPALAYALGDVAFETLCRDYIEEFPSRSPNLNSFGRSLPGYCRSRGAPWAAFGADLARLEWALVEALHAAPALALSPEALVSVAPEAWEGAVLRASDSLRILRFDYPVNTYFQAYRHDDEPAPPAASASATAVYRQGYTLWRMDLTPAMADLLDDLVAGRPLGEALGAMGERLTSADELAEAERGVMVWFQAWVAGGFFSAIDLGGAGGENQVF